MRIATLVAGEKTKFDSISTSRQKHKQNIIINKYKLHNLEDTKPN